MRWYQRFKYTPQYPDRPFADLLAARTWVQWFIDWYNHEHLHSAINFVTPEQRHQGLDVEILVQRKQVYEQVKSHHPERWSGEIRNWEPVGEVYLNPEKKQSEAEEQKAA